MDNLSLPSFSKKCSPLLYQKQCVAQIFRINIKVIIPRFGGGRSVDNLISRYVGWRDVAQFPSQVSFPVLSDDEMSKMSSPVCLVQRCHQSKGLFSTNHQFTNTFQISQYQFKIFVSFHSSSYYYQHGSRQSFSPVKLQYSLAESDPFLQRIRVSLLFQNKSSLSFYIHNYITSIHNILSQKWCTYI